MTEVIAWLGKQEADQIRIKNPFVIQLDVVPTRGSDWETEAVVITHMDHDGSVWGEGSEQDPVQLSSLDTHEIAFLLDELEAGNFIID